jgi:protein-S-isoprenylcysteine O-methyltransferase Ste14
MFSLILLGNCVAVASWARVILLVLAQHFGHFSILAEEGVCLKMYGQGYLEYVVEVHRYFLFF